MAPSKSDAIVLSILPYRETSAIVYLFTRNHGLIHAVARGLRNRKGDGRFLERGAAVETDIYIKSGRDLQTLGAITLTQAFPGIRADLYRTVVRDVALEVLLRTIRNTETHPELYDLLQRFLRNLEDSRGAGGTQLELWAFLLEFMSLLGFGLEIQRCRHCGADLHRGQQRSIHFGEGGCFCTLCRPNPPSTAILPPWFPDLPAPEGNPPPSLDQNWIQLSSVTRLLTAFCAYHFEISPKFKALEFMESLA